MSTLRTFCCTLAVAIAAWTALPPASAVAQTTLEAVDLEQSSLQFASADVSLYSGTYQLAGQLHQLSEGPFMTHLRDSHAGQKIQAYWQEKWDSREGEIGQVRAALENPNAVNWLSLLQDIGSEDLFVMAGPELPDTLVEFFSLYSEMIQIVTEQDPELITEFFTSLQKSEIDQIHIPTLVLGGKVSETEAADLRIKELQGLLTVLSMAAPQAQVAVSTMKYIEDDRGGRLSVTLRGDMIPWEQLRRNTFDDTQVAMLDKFEELISDRQIVFTVGLLDEFFIFGISETAEQIVELGQSDSSLLDIDEMEIVRDHADEQVLSIAYQSDDLAAANFEINLEEFFSRRVGMMLDAAFNQLSQEYQATDDTDEATKLEEQMELVESIREDMSWLDEQIGQHIPELLGRTAVAVDREDGFESFTMVRTPNLLLNGEEPLDILNHVGEDPYFVLAGRLYYHPEYFETARQIARKVRSYLDRLAASSLLDDEEKEHLNDFLDRGWPLIRRAADVIADQLLPSMEDGQFAYVANPSMHESTQWSPDMPVSQEALPFPTIAKIAGISDREAYVGALSDLLDIADEVVVELRAAGADDIPEDYSVPRPISSRGDDAEVYYYPLPQELALPDEMSPRLIVTDDYSYAGYSEPQLIRLQAGESEMPHTDYIEEAEGLAGVCYLDLAGLVGELMPWLHYAVTQAEDPVVPAKDGFEGLTQAEVLQLLESFSYLGQLVSTNSDHGDDGLYIRTRYFQATE